MTGRGETHKNYHNKVQPTGRAGTKAPNKVIKIGIIEYTITLKMFYHEITRTFTKLGCLLPHPHNHHEFKNG